MATSDTTLLVRHLPGELTPLEKEGLLRHFQATRVRVMSDTGRLKNCAFATFDDEESAKKALQRLHQLKVLGSVLVVEFARSTDQSHFPKLPPPPTSLGQGPAEKASEKELPPPVVEQWKPPQDEILKKHGIEYPRNPNLHYLYPSPTVSILTNIANALASHHRFYVQVLHLMNKLNLPAPFGPATPTPPIPSGHVGSEITESDNLVMEEMDVSTSEESEIDSDGESRPSTLQPVVKRRIRSNPNKIHKRRKLVLPFSQEKSVPRTGGVVCPSDVFEQPEQQQQTKKIQLNLPSNVMAEVTEAVSSETGQSDKYCVNQLPKSSPVISSVINVSFKSSTQLSTPRVSQPGCCALHERSAYLAMGNIKMAQIDDWSFEGLMSSVRVRLGQFRAVFGCLASIPTHCISLSCG